MKAVLAIATLIAYDPLDDCDRGSHDIETRDVCPCGDVRRVADHTPRAAA